MPSSNCDWQKYRASKIVWDNQSLVMNYPNIIDYSIENIPGLPYKIRWDINSEYLIQNPTNYSYSIYQSPDCKRYQIWIKRTQNSALSVCTWRVTQAQTSFTLFNIGNWIKPRYELIRSNGVVGCSGTIQTYNYDLKIYQDALCNGNYTLANTTRILNNGRDTDITEFMWMPFNHSQPCPYKIKIVDGNITTEYSINDINSVTIENSIASKKININGTKFDLINESSIALSCVNPIQEHCAKGLIECACGNQLCCYKPVSHGWQLVRTIPKIT